jgi:hypothetical protein
MTQVSHENDRWPIITFGVTILVSAFLLFQVQPLVSKQILPWFGGCPAVWTTCMLFFQTILFAGYLYAHLLQRWFTCRYQAILHLAVVLGGLALLPILPGVEYKPTDSLNPTWRILMLLMATVGLPYFALSATSPLIQAWFSRRCPGRSPYRLYALSNVGSLAALLTYPFVFEPAFDLPRQSSMWSWAFLTYAVLCAASLLWMWRVQDSAALLPEETPFATKRAKEIAPNAWLRIRWLGLPACASWMLLASTNHICQDVAVVPFLWILPLTLYLLSFIICFDQPRWTVRWLWAGAAVLELIGVAGSDHLKLASSPLNLVQELTLNGGALFFVCMVCHGELVRLKPSPRYLTEFYLMISAGGAIGGLLVAIIAPQIFSTFLEWKVGMVVSYAIAAIYLFASIEDNRFRKAPRWIIMALAALGLGYLIHWEFTERPAVARVRNFFGAIAMTEDDANDPEKHAFLLKHGHIIHGAQFVDPQKRRWPTTYYGEDSGAGVAIAFLHKSGPIRVGAVGLGTGTVASYAKPGDVFRFYEINPDVLKFAEERFAFLKDCQGKYEVVLGDARLSMDAEASQQFNLLIVDAFSGDAIPTHLLTREAFDVYRKHLAPGGIIAVHVSNTYLRLSPIVRQLANYCGMHAIQIEGQKNDDRLVYGNTWVLVTANEGFVAAHPNSEVPESAVMPLWTDQYSNLFQILGRE